ncbi:MAG TPA: protein translocase subunit SecF, partial [Actinomycetota bacterium]|nr:protein translocase subunit SecF [Actinomycetota bacterium]
PIESPQLAGKSDTDVVTRVREALSGIGVENAEVQVATSDQQRYVLVQTEQVSNPEKQNQLVNTVARSVGTDTQSTDSERIGSTWGGEITSKAIRALIIFLVAVIAYISWRFELKMAIAAIIALFHDLLITFGIYALVGFDVSPSTVVAILTILGYSLYDTVVVFDKVEENTTAFAATGRMTYQDAANIAMNQVFMRSLNTSLSTLIPVSALLFVGAGLLGASTLEDLALALLVGILVGTYSSIFVATPFLTIMKESEPRYRNVREKVLRDARRRSARMEAEPETATEGAAGERETEPATVPAGPPESRRPASPATSRGKVGSKKAKRRRRR